MLYTPKIQKAIKFSNLVHRGQIRKGKPNEPYILHPLGVGMILAAAQASEDQVTSGILHDTIEDCESYGSVTKEIIEKEFGKDVARMVNDVTEQDKSLPWAERKKAAPEHIKEMKKDSIMVKSADVLHNLSDLLMDLEEEADMAYRHFKAPKKELIKRFVTVTDELEKYYPANPILPELKKSVTKLINNSPASKKF